MTHRRGGCESPRRLRADHPCAPELVCASRRNGVAQDRARLLGCAVLVWIILGVAAIALALVRRRLEGGVATSATNSGEPGRPATGDPQTIPATIYRRPDPMIYDQFYLASLGLAVTWDNPDIHLERPPGTTVSSHDLLPNTEYEVVSRIWNLSETAPAPRLPVRVSYLRFGIGGGKTTFAETVVDLPVKGSPALPVRAAVTWTTPSAPGHYCLQTELMWPAAEDENPGNNVGQHNTDVKPLLSPATFVVPVRNDDLRGRRRLVLKVDSYAIPPLGHCEPDETHRSAKDAAGRARRRHDPGLFGIPEGWSVELSEAELELAALEERDVTVTVTAPDGFVGRQATNLAAYAEGRPVGGVTLYVEGA
jgi:hypothetical protein